VHIDAGYRVAVENQRYLNDFQTCSELNFHKHEQIDGHFDFFLEILEILNILEILEISKIELF